MHRSIESAHLLHYRTLMFEERLPDKEDQLNVAQHSPYAELILRPTISIQDNSALYYSICSIFDASLVLPSRSNSFPSR